MQTINESRLSCDSNMNVGIKKCDGNYQFSKGRCKIFKPYSTFSYLKQRFILASCKHRIIFCLCFVAKTSKYREHLLVVFILTLEATVLKVIRIVFIPTDNDKLVILNIIFTLIICKSTVRVNFINRNLIFQKLGKTNS